MVKAVYPLLLVAVAIFGMLPSVVLGSSGFTVAPSRLEITVPEHGSSTAYVYITSHLDGELIVGTEDIPFRVEPETIPVSSVDKNKKVELQIYGDPAVGGGKYTGKLTFLALTDENLALGIKIDVYITKISEKGFIERYIVIIAAVAAMVVAIIIGILIWRRGRHRPQPALARKRRHEKPHSKSRIAR
jgi:hypothetical protein